MSVSIEVVVLFINLFYRGITIIDSIQVPTYHVLTKYEFCFIGAGLSKLARFHVV